MLLARKFWGIGAAATDARATEAAASPAAAAADPPAAAVLPKPRPVVHDLVRAVFGPDAVATEAEVKRLDQFIRANRDAWAVMWPDRYCAKPGVLLTHIDVEHDPIVSVLQQWMPTTTPPPTYPAAVDARPPAPVPPALAAMDPDVWPILRRAGLAPAFAGVMTAYHPGGAAATQAAAQPHDERLRQFQRLAAAHEYLSCREICDCLGWALHSETNLLRAITTKLMARADRPGGAVPKSLWYNTDLKPKVALWRHDVCLWEMRIAAIFILRLRHGKADTRFLHTNVERR